MPALEDNEEVKLEPKQTISESVKLIPRKRKNEGTRLKILNPSNLSPRLSILSVQKEKKKKTGKNSYKLKNEIKQILYLLYQLYQIVSIWIILYQFNHGRKYDCDKRSRNFLL